MEKTDSRSSEKVSSDQISQTYRMVNRLLQGSRLDLMNHGYYVKNSRYSNQENLYMHLVKDIDISNMSVLDIGCGRGGGLRVLTSQIGCSRAVGLDMVVENIEFCKSNQDSQIEFVLGDAQKLPFGDMEFDVVTNVESAHCYPDYDAFVKEVFRVLKPGGFFVSADSVLIDESHGNQYYANIERLGQMSEYFEISEYDITDLVAKACLDDLSLSDQDDSGNWLIRQVAKNMSESYSRGMAKYVKFVCRKIG